MRYYHIFSVFLRLVLSFILYPLFYATLHRKKYIIIGTRNGIRGHDNAEYLASYCKKNGIMAKVIYNDGLLDGELKKNSIISILYILYSSHVYITHSESDILDYFWRFIPGVKYIFIQHGVIGIKKLPDYEKKRYYKYISSNEYECEVLKNNYGLNDDNIIKSGLIRFDSYNFNETVHFHAINCLIMFTWRKSDAAKNDLIQYYLDIIEILIKEKIGKIYVCIHEANLLKFREKLLNSLPSGKRIIFITNNELSNIILKTNLLITDYSSISWDYLYQNKNVLFYTPDIEYFKQTVGLYCDFRNFFGANLTKIEHENIQFISWILDENKKNNLKFLTKYKFYKQYTGKHTNCLLQNTQAFEINL